MDWLVLRAVKLYLEEHRKTGRLEGDSPCSVARIFFREECRQQLHDVRDPHLARRARRIASLTFAWQAGQARISRSAPFATASSIVSRPIAIAFSWKTFRAAPPEPQQRDSRPWRSNSSSVRPGIARSTARGSSITPTPRLR